MQHMRCLTQLDLGQQLFLMQPPHCYIKHTCVPSRKGIRSAALCGFSGQGSGSWRACFRTATLVLRPAAPASLGDPDVQFCSCIFQHESVFEAQRRNPRSSLSVLCFPDWNHQLSSSNSSKQLGDTATSAAAIWDPIISLYDTLYVSNNNLVYLRASMIENGFWCPKGNFSCSISATGKSLESGDGLLLVTPLFLFKILVKENFSEGKNVFVTQSCHVSKHLCLHVFLFFCLQAAEDTRAKADCVYLCLSYTLPMCKVAGRSLWTLK